MRYEQMSEALGQLREKNNLRILPTFRHDGKYACKDGKKMLNLSTNDYLGLAATPSLQESFYQTLHQENCIWSASSSRLLTGNFEAHRQLETLLARLFGKEAALTFNSGYHANSGIVSALADKNTLIVADKLVHASLIDGIRLSGADCVRYKHNRYDQLEKILQERHDRYESILIVTESVFSMDGDKADLKRLCALKRQYPHTMLYVDEAHAFGVFGEHGLGCAEEQNCLEDIDILIGTFGKAIASAGAFVVCRQLVKDYLVNTMRPFIFTTALPPINAMWTQFIIRHLDDFADRREHLQQICRQCIESLRSLGYECQSSSAILPITVGESSKAVRLAEQFQQRGFYVLPVRPPTVPEGTSRLRLSLTAALTDADITSLIQTFQQLL